MSLMKTNVSHVADNIYIVRTQAGFRNALKHHFDNWKELRIIDFPPAYPSLVTLSRDALDRVWCNPIHLNVIKAAIAQSEARSDYQQQHA